MKSVVIDSLIRMRAIEVGYMCLFLGHVASFKPYEGICVCAPFKKDYSPAYTSSFFISSLAFDGQWRS